MKAHIKHFLCVVLALAMCASCFGLSAGADYSYEMNVGENYGQMAVYQFYRDIIDVDYSSAQGVLVPGLVYDFDETFLYVRGTPTKPGVYTIRGIAETEDGNGETYEFTITVLGENQGGGDIQVPGMQQPLLAPLLTKSPTDETVFEGNSAMFIARADEAEKIEWYLVEPDSYSAYTMPQAASYIEGLRYSGDGTEVLELYNIPLEMDGWMVECLFINSFGSTMSETATVHVDELKLVNPTIKTQPQSAEKDMDSAHILSVIADNNTKGSELKYQWYMSATGSGNLNPISGANTSSYTPPKTAGTVYYTVAVWSSIDGMDSGKTYSTPAAVTYTKAEASAPSPSVMPSASPSAVPAISPSPNSNVQGDKNEDKGGGIGLMGVLVVVLILSAALAAVILLILRKNRKAPDAGSVPFMEKLMNEAEEEKAEEEVILPVQPRTQRVPKEWLCACGALNNSPFCIQCGRARPVVKPCSKCGWTPESVNKIPHFCPECGTAFEEE